MKELRSYLVNTREHPLQEPTIPPVEQRNKKTYLKFDAGENRENVEY